MDRESTIFMIFHSIDFINIWFSTFHSPW
jgi:hypothetical protein